MGLPRFEHPGILGIEFVGRWTRPRIPTVLTGATPAAEHRPPHVGAKGGEQGPLEYICPTQAVAAECPDKLETECQGTEHQDSEERAVDLGRLDAVQPERDGRVRGGTERIGQGRTWPWPWPWPWGRSVVHLCDPTGG